MVPVSSAAQTRATMPAASAVSSASAIGPRGARIGGHRLFGGDLGDPTSEVDVLLGHPVDDVLRAFVVAVVRVAAQESQLDIAFAQPSREGGGLTLVAGVAHCADEPHAGSEALPTLILRAVPARAFASLRTSASAICRPK